MSPVVILTLATATGAITVFHGQGCCFINDGGGVYDLFLGLNFRHLGIIWTKSYYLNNVKHLRFRLMGSKQHSFYLSVFDRMEMLLFKQGRSGNSIFSRKNNSSTEYCVKQYFGGLC